MTPLDPQDQIVMKDVLNRLKSAIGVTQDNELAKELGVNNKTIATWKSRNTVPTKKLTEFCSKHSIDLQAILTGKGRENLPRPQTAQSSFSAFPELEMVFKEANSLCKRLDTTTRLQLAATLSKHIQSVEKTHPKKSKS